jgi:hypothetical protein
MEKELFCKLMRMRIVVLLTIVYNEDWEMGANGIFNGI